MHRQVRLTLGQKFDTCQLASLDYTTAKVTQAKDRRLKPGPRLPGGSQARLLSAFVRSSPMLFSPTLLPHCVGFGRAAVRAIGWRASRRSAAWREDLRAAGADRKPEGAMEADKELQHERTKQTVGSQKSRPLMYAAIDQMRAGQCEQAVHVAI